MARARFELAVAKPFELPLAVTGHGWYDLAPHRYQTGAARFETVIAYGEAAYDVAVEQRGAKLVASIDGAGAADAAARAAVRAALRRILRLDHDFAPFWKRCQEWPSVRWAAKRGGGRLLASATLFEDLLKLLFTTNCSWAATRLMAQRLCDALGAKAPSGRAAFPSAAACAEASEKFWRETVRAGYRARGARALARRFAEKGGTAGDARNDPAAAFEGGDVTTDELRERLLALDGFGPYAAGQALRLLGRHDDLALDSWCRAQLAKQLGKKRPPGDRAIERRYARYGADRGLVLWLELTAEWHGEAGDATASWLADHGGR